MKYEHLKELDSETLLTIYVMSENEEKRTIELASDPVHEYLRLEIGEVDKDDEGNATGVIKNVGCWTSNHLPITTIFESDFPNWQVGTSVRITFRESRDMDDYDQYGDGTIERN